MERGTWMRWAGTKRTAAISGAAVLGNQLLIDYLINFSRSFIYSTALPPEACASIYTAYLLAEKASENREMLSKNIDYFKETAALLELKLLNSNSAIQGVYVSGNNDGKAKELRLREQGLACKAILSPTVPKGNERLRVSIHSYNTFNLFNGLCSKCRIAFSRGK